jgi:hypothetical protein
MILQRDPVERQGTRIEKKSTGKMGQMEDQHPEISKKRT